MRTYFRRSKLILCFLSLIHKPAFNHIFHLQLNSIYRSYYFLFDYPFSFFSFLFNWILSNITFPPNGKKLFMYLFDLIVELFSFCSTCYALMLHLADKHLLIHINIIFIIFLLLLYCWWCLVQKTEWFYLLLYFYLQKVHIKF